MFKTILKSLCITGVLTSFTIAAEDDDNPNTLSVDEFMSTHYEDYRNEALQRYHHEGRNIVTINDDADESVLDEPDPLENLNRIFFGFNRFLDGLILRPAAVLYRDCVNDTVKSGVENFLENLFTPLYIVNNLLQGEGERACHMVGRFAMNTTFGFLGLFDVGTEMGLEKHLATFNQTLAKWTVETGPYLMLPFFGPSCFRDAFGKLGDIFLNPFTYAVRNHKRAGNHHGQQRYWLMGAYGVDLIVRRSKLIEATDMIERDSLDPYVTIRSVYFQKQQEMEALFKVKE